ncbi:hypothetical protein N9R81_00585 [Flavobacteriales bacterium]|nr:hypothetical protein [Flavobacteriales bacterium]
MQIYCTTCCKEKSTKQGKIPAIQRYLDERITTCYHKSQQAGKGFRILSGKYGLLAPTDTIPWYDQVLLEHEINNMIDLVALQLQTDGISSLVFYAKDPSLHPDWSTYVHTMVEACNKLAINLEVKFLD